MPLTKGDITGFHRNRCRASTSPIGDGYDKTGHENWAKEPGRVLVLRATMRALEMDTWPLFRQLEN